MMRNQEYLRKEYSSGVTSSSKISGATNGNCDDGFEGEEDLSHMKRKLGHKSNYSASPPTKVVADRFVAYSADYHGPKRHPPKHN